MNLPDGVIYQWRRRNLWLSLISVRGDDGLIRINSQPPHDNDSGYQVHNRTFSSAIAPYLKGDWEDLDRLFELQDLQLKAVQDAVYSGGEHNGDPKSPNITVVPNLHTKRGFTETPLMVFGCTMGHYHSDESSAYRVQEVYEFQSYGLMAIDRGQGEIELWVADDGDKVAVPNRCHMTLYNLDSRDVPLVTLDFANPERNPADKEFVKQYGPAILAYYDGSDVVFTLNRLYINNLEHQAGIRLYTLPSDLKNRQVIIPLGSRLTLGQYLYEQLTGNPDVIGQFARLGVRIRKASPEVVLEPVPPAIVLEQDQAKSVKRTLRIHFSAPLVKATRPGTRVYRYFFPTAPKAQSGEPYHDIAAKEKSLRPELPVFRALNRPLVLVVEGTGDWVDRAYRPVFEELSDEGYSLSVFYADDTQWMVGQAKEIRERMETRCQDFIQSLKPWEIYLDKAQERDLAIYRNLVPDAVFVVTPDFTHSKIARDWIDKAPLILVEKPFDSNLDNLYNLVQARGFSQGITRIVGLDHYRFYALPLRDLMPAVVKHLGGALDRVVFYIAESAGIKPERSKSLQHGLTLDMLPHFLALLLFFGDLATVDAISVIKAGQYDPPLANFKNETASYTTFTFEDYSGNEYPVACEVVVGKGFERGVKYLEINGRNGKAIRIDFGQTVTNELIALVVQRNDGSERMAETAIKTVVDYLENYLPALAFAQIGDVLQVDELIESLPQGSTRPQDAAEAAVEKAIDYIKQKLPGDSVPERIDGALKMKGSIFFLQRTPLPDSTITMTDPYDSGRQLHILKNPGWISIERARYKALLKDLLRGGEGTGFAGTMSFSESWQMMAALERVWKVVQADKPNWESYRLGGSDAVYWA